MRHRAERLDVDSPLGLAYRMASYIADPKYIAAYVAREYGTHRAPTVEQCRAYRERHERLRDEFRRLSDAPCGYDADNDNGESYRVPGNSGCLAPIRGVPTRVYHSRGRARVMELAHVKIAFADLARIDGLPHNQILRGVAECFGLTVADLKGGRRITQHIAARQVAIRLLRDVRLSDGSPRFSYPKIGQMMGGKDHSTIIHAIKTFDIKAKQYPEIAAAYAYLKGLGT